MSPWVYLLLAGLFEIGWPYGLKIAQQDSHRILGISMAVICMIISGALLFLAQKQIPIGTAYAIWTGIGAAGTFVLGVLVFGDAMGMMRLLGLILIIGGVAVLKLSH
ncbi:MAG TPA: hypothetical protein DIS76_02885 [Rhodospirillaceae bacterium]|nr:hypothetical protein [Rhodospirillaceae bacterium]